MKRITIVVLISLLISGCESKNCGIKVDDTSICKHDTTTFSMSDQSLKDFFTLTWEVSQASKSNENLHLELLYYSKDTACISINKIINLKQAKKVSCFIFNHALLREKGCVILNMYIDGKPLILKNK